MEEQRTDFIHFVLTWYAPILLTPIWTEEG